MNFEFEIKLFQTNFIGFLQVKFVNILKYSNKKTVLHLQNINLLGNLKSEQTGRVRLRRPNIKH